MISFPLAFLAFIFGFGFLVFIHELGHFLVAKWCDIRCTQFALGFGPAMISYRKGIGFRFGTTEPEYFRRAGESLTAAGRNAERATQEETLAAADAIGLGETEYRLNYLPLGGYVKMLGQEDMDAAAQSSDPRAFNSKSVGARFAVISAGVIMNMITGIALFIGAFMAGVEFPPAAVGGVDPTMPAAQAYAEGHEGDPRYHGLRVADRIVAIDGERTTDFTDVKIASALGAAEAPITLTVERPGESGPLTYRVTPKMDAGDRLLSFGIMPPGTLKVGAVGKESEEFQAGLRADMVAVAIDGEPILDFADYHQRIAAKRGEPAQVEFRNPEKAGESVTIAIAAQPPLVPGVDQFAGVLGFKPATRISAVVEESPAANAGIQKGDLLAELSGVPWPAVDQVSKLVKEADGRSVSVVVWRNGGAVPVGEVQPRDNMLGIGLGMHLDEPIVGQTLGDSPAAALNLSGGSRITSIAGQPVNSWPELYRIVAGLKAEGEAATQIPVEFRLNAADSPATQGVIEAPAATLRGMAEANWLVPGYLMVPTNPELPGGFMFDIRREPVVAANPWDATLLGLTKTKQFIAQAYLMILRLAQNTVTVQHLRGPVGIVDEGTKVAQGGWSYLAYFLGLLSVNLAVINFLPIPIADGGHAVFLLAEKIKGSPVSPSVQVGAMYVGLLLIGGLFLLVTYHDIARLAGFGF